MRPALRALFVAVSLAATMAPAAMWAQSAQRSTAALIAERDKLRADLDQVNAEIADLKQSGRGVRSDYLLRQRMAESESLARRLTTTEAQLREAIPAPAVEPPPTVPAPEAGPGDGPEQLEAKADLLADQSRALVREADALVMRAGQIRGRQGLRRAAAGLDRDPFAAMEGSKRRTISVTGGSNGRGSPAPEAGKDKAGGTGGTGGALGPGGQGGQGGAGGSGGAGGAPDSGGVPPSGVPPISVRGRDLLDPGTLAELRRLEIDAAGGDVRAMDKAAAALRQRASQLDAQARALRDRAKR